MFIVDMDNDRENETKGGFTIAREWQLEREGKAEKREREY